MASSSLELTRGQILAFRRRVGELDERLPPGARSLRQAAWAGLQDSMPRAALLSIHARVQGAHPSSWEDKSLAQVWGPRFSVYVVPARDHAIFTLGRHPDDARGRQRAEEMAARIHAFLAGRRLKDNEVAAGLGVHNALRYATTTGTVLIRWAGARAPVVWTVPLPEIEPLEARRELARRYLHVYGPTTPEAFAVWAGIGAKQAATAFESLAPSLLAVRTPIGDAWILARDERLLREAAGPPAAARLLPSGDAYWLLQGADRELLVPDATRRGALWTPRVWPGAVLVGGEIAGTWRRAQAKLTIEPWRRLSRAERSAVEAEAQSLPLPGLEGEIRVGWSE
ncbi:MAG TPA: crosslink repair DNA glycosylase YcaQ family protein [Thermoanaerobaculia bacterium]|nr:crosslink repair DNA glycosylase YcaQ family protein [Thermoanaerobaculia bacterium]